MKIVIIMLSLLSATGYADVYRTVDEHGNIIFSDTPADNAERITIDVAPGYQPPAIVPLGTEDESKIEQPSWPEPAYQIRISSPRQNQTFQNPETIAVTATVEPELDGRRADKVVFKLDGKAVTKPQKQLSTVLKNVDRGSHIVTVSVVDKKGKTIKTSRSVLFHVQRHSILLHNNR